jgi:hypothetical protein
MQFFFNSNATDICCHQPELTIESLTNYELRRTLNPAFSMALRSSPPAARTASCRAGFFC